VRVSKKAFSAEKEMGERIPKTYTKALEEILCLAVDIQLAALGVLGEVESRNLWDVLIFSLTLFFLELEGDTTDWTTLDTLHQVTAKKKLIRNTTKIQRLAPIGRDREK
jgi:hypothetical protein